MFVVESRSVMHRHDFVVGATIALVWTCLSGCAGSSTGTTTGTTTGVPETGPATTRPASDATPSAATPADESSSIADNAVANCSLPAGMDGLTELSGDLDGDGSTDRIVVLRTAHAEETTIAACGTALAVEVFHVGDANKPINATVVDFDGDGMDELLLGVPTGAKPYVGQPLRLVGSRLEDLGFVVGVTAVGRTGSSFGCVDVDGDGVQEVVSLDYAFDGATVAASNTVRWTRTVLYDANGKAGSADSGTFDTQSQSAAVTALLSGTCGETTVIGAPR